MSLELVHRSDCSVVVRMGASYLNFVPDGSLVLAFVGDRLEPGLPGTCAPYTVAFERRPAKLIRLKETTWNQTHKSPLAVAMTMLL